MGQNIFQVYSSSIVQSSFEGKCLSMRPCHMIPMSACYMKSLKSFCDCYMTIADPEQTVVYAQADWDLH